jgi:hypothetical protein
VKKLTIDPLAKIKPKISQPIGSRRSQLRLTGC